MARRKKASASLIWLAAAELASISTMQAPQAPASQLDNIGIWLSLAIVSRVGSSPGAGDTATVLLMP